MPAAGRLTRRGADGSAGYSAGRHARHVPERPAGHGADGSAGHTAERLAGFGAEQHAQRWRLRVDWPRCRAEGLCHELVPEIVQLDQWGYPIITGPVSEQLLANAKAAVRACPRMAVRVVD
ncbi:MAG: ferredoxin [Frankiaceae bacterium]|nr:ferredoxin [Frankiaceae bacterium]